MANLVTVLAQRDILDAMVQRLDKFLSETGENVSWKHGAVYSAIELIKDLRARLKAAETELADAQQRVAAVELERDEWHEVCTRMSITLGKTEERAETAEAKLVAVAQVRNIAAGQKHNHKSDGSSTDCAACLVDAIREALQPQAAEAERWLRTRQRLAAVERILADRERELLKTKGPCSNESCRLHHAHSGPCDERTKV